MSAPRPASPRRRRAGEAADVVLLGGPAAGLALAAGLGPLLASVLALLAVVAGRAVLVPAGAAPGGALLGLCVVAEGGARPGAGRLALLALGDLGVVVLSLGLAAPRLLLDAAQDPWRRTPLDRLVGLVVLDVRRPVRAPPAPPRAAPLVDVTAELAVRLRERRRPWLLDGQAGSTPVGEGVALAGLRWRVDGDVLVALPEVDGVTLVRGAAARPAPRGRAVAVLPGDAVHGPEGVLRVRRDENVF